MWPAPIFQFSDMARECNKVPHPCPKKQFFEYSKHRDFLKSCSFYQPVVFLVKVVIYRNIILGKYRVGRKSRTKDLRVVWGKQCKKSGIKHPFFSLNVSVTITFRFGWFQSKFIFCFNLPLICFKFFGARLKAHPVYCL